MVKSKINVALLGLLLCAGAFAKEAQWVIDLHEAHTLPNAYVDANGVTQSMPYRLLRPLNYDPSRLYPVIVSLHSYPGCGTDNETNIRQWNTQLCDPQLRADYPAYVLVPQTTASGEWRYNGELENVQNIISSGVSSGLMPNVDMGRIYVLGQSMGGYGTWWFIRNAPAYFAAAAPVSGGWQPGNATNTAKIKDIPIWAFHGTADTTVNYSLDYDFFNLLNLGVGNEKFTTFQGKGHSTDDYFIPYVDNTGMNNGTTQFSDANATVKVCDPEPVFMKWLFSKRLAGWYPLTVNGGSVSGSYPSGQQVTISANALTGRTFVQWAGDTLHVSNATASSTTVTMPGNAVTLTATYALLPGWYSLTVNSGSGGGVYANGTAVPIVADDPPAGQVFDQWTGDTQYLSNATASSSTVTLSGQNVSLTATYKSVYALTVNSGSGSGLYTNGQQVAITANSVVGQSFDRWTGDVQYVNNVTAPNATVTMPANAVTLTATYASLPTVSGMAATGVTTNAATLHGSVDSIGGATLLDYGFFYGDATGVTTASTKVSLGVPVTSGTNTWTTPGTYTWSNPNGVTSIQIECWGAGGAGGWASKTDSTSGTAGCGGGAGGVYAMMNSYSVIPGNTYYVKVGAGGVSSITHGATGPGGSSWFNSANSEPSGAGSCVAKGGAGAASIRTASSTSNTSGTGATGTASGSYGDIVYAGGSGGNGSTANGGSGGGSGGTAGAGNNGANASTTAGTQALGADAVAGGGPGGNGSAGTQAGYAPSNSPGGGGGGARCSSTNQTFNGGSGANGKVVLVYRVTGALPIDLPMTGLSPNTAIYYRAYASNAAGLALSPETSVFTQANVPALPTVNGATPTTLNVNVAGAANGNPGSTQFAIQETNSGSYVHADGALGASAIWQDTSAWGTVTVTGLTPGTTYAFQLKARNGDHVETAFGPAASAPVPLAYDYWVSQNALTQGPTGDDDGDGRSNLYEFGLGGNPANAGDHGIAPTLTLKSDGTSSWCEFVHAQRSDPNSGLLYHVQISDDLVSWTNASYTEIGSASLANGMISVTKRIEMGGKPRQYLRLLIEKP